MLRIVRHAVRQLLLKAVPEDRHDAFDRRVVKMWDDFLVTPITSAHDSLTMPSQPRVALLRSAPTAPQVLANYTRGLLLYGRTPAFASPLMWRSFPYRSIITAETAKVPRDVRRLQRRSEFKVKFDEDFEPVIHGCLEGRDDCIWITPAVIDVYREVHKLGFVATVGVYRDDELVAGLWGISVGRVFGILSAFHRENGAGSLAVGALMDVLTSDQRWSVIDNGLITPHYARFGAYEVPTEEFCERVWRTMNTSA
jgi:leucyl/phenylalanyl-tRNA--protein transferase